MRIDCLRKHSTRLLANTSPEMSVESQAETVAKIENELADLNEPLENDGLQAVSFCYEPGSTLAEILKLIQSHGKIRLVTKQLNDAIKP